LFLLPFGLGSSGYADRIAHASQLLRDVRAFLSAIVREEGRPDTVVLASKLAAVGYRLTIRTALGGGAGRSCFHNLHHEFLLVMGHPESGTPQDKEFIVDPNFRCDGRFVFSAEDPYVVGTESCFECLFPVTCSKSFALPKQ
jgi:hypothetical protein